MKLLYLLVLAILPMLLIPAFADSVGTIEWTKPHYALNEFPEIIVIDNDLNVNSSIFETVEIDIWSTSDAGGTDIILTETGSDTGVFSGSITLSTTEESHGTILKIKDGDILTAEYEDNTLPIPPYNYGNELDITSITYISNNSPPIITITTDKLKYFENETVIINGTIDTLVDGGNIYIEIIYDSVKVNWGYLYHSNEGIFTKTFNITNMPWENIGEFLVKVSYVGQTAETTFEILPPLIQLSTDKPSYNEIETIYITGETTLDTSILNDVQITLHDKDNNIIISDKVQVINGEFTHNITTDTIKWNGYVGDVKITATLQGNTAEYTIYYSSYPELSLESLYDMANQNDIMISSMYAENDIKDADDTNRDILVSNLGNQIVTLQTQIDSILLILSELTSIEPPQMESNPPMILSIIANDPDNLDTILSIDDTITILFDSNTSRPGGVNAQTKGEINDLFTFTEQIGQTYRGKWLAPDTFEITIKSVKNSALTIGTTTVTPAGITLILSADNTSTPSNSTSPVLIGNWGMP